jgi:biopolymer transport protein ExbD
MRRTSLHILIASLTLIAGIEFHRRVVSAANFALEYYTVVLEEPVPVAEDSCCSSPCFYWKTNRLVISMAEDRRVYLGKKSVGTPDDTRELEQKLAMHFNPYEMQPSDLGKAVFINNDCNAIYIKAHPDCSYRDIVRLMEAARRSGVHNIGLIADWRKGDARCAGRYVWQGNRFECLKSN